MNFLMNQKDPSFAIAKELQVVDYFGEKMKRSEKITFFLL